MEGLALIAFGLVVLLVLDVLAMRFGVDSRRQDEGWSAQRPRRGL